MLCIGKLHLNGRYKAEFMSFCYNHFSQEMYCHITYRKETFFSEFILNR